MHNTHIQGLNTSSFISHNINKSLLRKGTNLTFLNKHISTVEKLDQNGSLKENVREKPKQICIPLTARKYTIAP